MKIHTMSVRTHSVFTSFYRRFVYKAQFDTWFSKGLKLKDDAVPTILDLTVMSQHTSVSNCLYYVVTIVLSVKQIV